MKIPLLIGILVLLLACQAKEQKLHTSENVPTQSGDTLMIEDLKVSRDSKDSSMIFEYKNEPFTGVVWQSTEGSCCDFYWTVKNGKASYQKSFYSSGAIDRILEMKNGVQHGQFMGYFPDGGKYVEQYYHYGKPVGTWYRWNNKGALVETIEHSGKQLPGIN